MIDKSRKIVDEDQLEKLMTDLRNKNWKVDKIIENMNHKKAIDIINNWPKNSRHQLLNLLNIEEMKFYTFKTE